MTTNITSIFREDTVNNSNYKITKILSKYTEKKVNKDKSVTFTFIVINMMIPPLKHF